MSNSHLKICVGRQLGSGGCEIAEALAKEFGAKFYDHELINIAAEGSGFNPRIFEKQDERHGVLKSIIGSFTERWGRTTDCYDNMMSQESLFQIQSDAIQKAAAEGNCVFVGRCADYILRNEKNTFSVFITADEEERTKVVSLRNGCSMDEARSIIQKKEAQRADYYNYYTSKKWGAADSYDLCINSSLLGIEMTVRMIADIIRKSTQNQ